MTHCGDTSRDGRVVDEDIAPRTTTTPRAIPCEPRGERKPEPSLDLTKGASESDAPHLTLFDGSTSIAWHYITFHRTPLSKAWNFAIRRLRRDYYMTLHYISPPHLALDDST